jgi:hypothetical protein
LNRLAVGKALDWQVVAPIRVHAVRREGVDLVGCISAVAQTFACSATRTATDNDHVSVPGAPFALNSDKSAGEIENEVVPATLGDRPVYVNAKLGRRVNDGSFGNGSLLIRCHCCQR